MEIRLEMAKVLGQFVSNEMVTPQVIILSTEKECIRISSILNINTSQSDTEIEEHSYKDYTVTSDSLLTFVRPYFNDGSC
jgi:hypothetical protein